MQRGCRNHLDQIKLSEKHVNKWIYPAQLKLKTVKTGLNKAQGFELAWSALYRL